MPHTLGQYWSLLRRYVGPQRPRLLLLAFILFSGTALQVATPLLLRRFIDAARTGTPLDALVVVALAFLGVSLLTQVLGLLETGVAEDVAWAATNDLRADLAAHCLTLDLGFHYSHPPGDLIQRVDYDVGTLTNFFSRFLLRVVASILLLVGILAVLTALAPLLGLAFVAYVVGAVALLYAIRRVGVPFARADLQTMGTQFGYIEERLAGTEDVRTRGAIEYVLHGLYPLMRDRLRARRAAGATGMVIQRSVTVVVALGTALAYTLGGTLFLRGVLTLGTVYALMTYLALVTQPLSQLTQQVQDLQQAVAAIGRVEELFAATSAVSEGRGEPLPDGPLSVSLTEVSFAYAFDVPVLRDLTLALPPGSVLGVLGRTGSGKSTLARLLLRLHDPTTGAVSLGGVDLRETCAKGRRGRVAMVAQEVQLFHGTVRDNLTFFDRTIRDAQILDALYALHLQAWYASLPDGLDTRIAAGSALSAGEAQLLALARVFLLDPGLVILDEASARIDPATEHDIEHALDVLLRGRTAVVIAHRLATVQRADAILVLDGGRVAEFGRREDLLRDPASRYVRLLRTGMEVVSA